MLVIALGVGIGSLAKGTTGLGFQLVAVPVIATFLGVEFAVVVMALPGIVTNHMLLWEYRHVAAGMRHLPVMLAAGAVGAAVGTFLLRASPERALSLVLALLVFGYIAMRLTHPDFRLSPAARRWTAPTVGTLGGALQGLTGVSGPLIGTYFHAWGLPREAYVFSVNAMFQLYAVVQVTTFVALGLYTPTRILASVVALFPVLVFLPLGVRLGRRLPPEVFERVILAVMLAMGLSLVTDALGVRPW